jgi:hypothetical protein
MMITAAAAQSVKIQVEPAPKENAAPGLDSSCRLKKPPGSEMTAWPARRDSAHSLVPWSAAITTADSTSTVRSARPGPDPVTGPGSVEPAGLPASSPGSSGPAPVITEV